MPLSYPKSPDMSDGSRTPGGLDAAHHALIETARRLGSSRDPEDIFARTRDCVREAVPCDGLIVSSFDRQNLVIRCTYAWVDGKVIDPSTFPPVTYRSGSGGMQSQVIRTGRPMLFSDVAERVRAPETTYYEVDPAGNMRNLHNQAPSCRSAIMVPLRLEGEVVGVVQVMADTENAYSATQLELLEGIALLLAVSLENARLYRLAQEEIQERRRAEEILHRTQEELRAANLRKDEFLATLGHELRNPLNPIRSAIEVLRRKGVNDPDVRWGHELIDRQVVHITRLIDDLLDVSRITQGKLELRLERVELNQVLAGCLDILRPTLEAAGKTVVLRSTGEPLFLEADPVRLTQIFSNLLDNAAKYSGSGRSIEVEIQVRESKGTVVVLDYGTGIAADHLPHVFDLFYQVDRSMGRAHGGLGIGLTLVKRLVEMHGGDVEASSDGPGHGSRFIVRLPLVPESSVAGESRSTVPGTPRPMRLLIADDNRDSAQSMARLLRSCGHEVQVAYDGEEALHAAENDPPDVLILDIGMPRLDGYELARRVRAAPWGRDVSLIAATGWGQDEDRQRSLESGFDAHLVKPID
ncbi:MAG TPA: ATP-binding protein, partial [Candidatus Eisenbacteria bacterium]|nr:ATP-binding protein [Candidatus Eisenbacteria bacterium]